MLVSLKFHRYNFRPDVTVTTSLAKEVMFSVVWVRLLVSNITQNIMNGQWWNFVVGSGVVKGRTDKSWWRSGSLSS